MPEAPMDLPIDNVDDSEKRKKSTILDYFSTALKEHKKEKIKPFTKLVIRRMPPRMTENEFMNEFELPPHDYIYFVRGDLALGNYSFSRAYVNLINVEDGYKFQEKYDDHPLNDEQGRAYHVVVEWAPMQKYKVQKAAASIPKSGTIESDPSYIEFLEKLEKEKNVANVSEYFMETDALALKEAKVTTTPLLEFIKQKRQQKIDLRNESRIKKREAEKERRKRDEELRKAERVKKIANKELKSNDAIKEKGEKESIKSPTKEKTSESTYPQKSDTFTMVKVGHPRKEVKHDEKNKTSTKISDDDKSSEKRRVEETSSESPSKSAPGFKKKLKTASPKKAAVTKKESSSEEVVQPIIKAKGQEDQISVGEVSEGRKAEISGEIIKRSSNQEGTKKKELAQIKDSKRKELSSEKTRQEESKRETSQVGEPKSRFRYSEQRTRERDARNQSSNSAAENKLGSKKSMPDDESQSIDSGVAAGKRLEKRQPSQETSDSGSFDGDEGRGSSGSDPRTQRRIRNKDRPAMEIYRPGMGRFSKKKVDSKNPEIESKVTKKTESESALPDSN